MKKTVTLLLAVLLLIGCLVACQNPSSEGPSTTDPVGGTTDAVTDDGLYHADYLPDKGYNGYTIRSMTMRDSPNVSLDIDPDTQNKLYVARYTAVEQVKDQFDFEVEETYKDTWEQTSEALMLMSSAESDETDFIMLIHREVWKYGIRGYLADWESLPYCDETQPWYITDYNDAQRVMGVSVYNYTWAESNLYQTATGVIMNRSMLEDLQLEDPYDLVDNNEWTIDKMISLMRVATSDLNNDSVINDNDRVGIAGERDNVYPGLWMGAGFKMVDNDPETGKPYLVADQNERFYDMLDQLSDLAKERVIYSTTTHGTVNYGNDQREGAVQMFKNGVSLFWVHVINSLSKLADVEFEYGMVPYPKYDETQEKYISRNCDVWSPLIVPNTCQHREEASVFLEAFAVESVNYVYDAYYREVLQDRYSDEKTKEMLDIIRGSVMLDLGDTIWQEYARNYVISRIDNGTKDFASCFEQVGFLLNMSIDRDLKFLEEIAAERG